MIDNHSYKYISMNQQVFSYKYMCRYIHVKYSPLILSYI